MALISPVERTCMSRQSYDKLSADPRRPRTFWREAVGRAGTSFGARLRKRRNRTQRSAAFEADRRRVLVKADANRIAAFRDFLQLHTQPAPDHPDTLIAGDEVLVGMVGNGALADLNFVVSRELLVFIIGHLPPVFSVEL
jgi:hypothetical protein